MVMYTQFTALFRLFWSLLPFINHQARSTNHNETNFFIFLHHTAKSTRSLQTLLTNHENRMLLSRPKIQQHSVPETLLWSCTPALLPFCLIVLQKSLHTENRCIYQNAML